MSGKRPPVAPSTQESSRAVATWNMGEVGHVLPAPTTTTVSWSLPRQCKPPCTVEVSPQPLAADQTPADTRASCGQLGHFSRVYLDRQNRGSKASGADVRHVSGLNPPAEIYLHAQLGNQVVNCLLETGREKSLIRRKLIPN